MNSKEALEIMCGELVDFDLRLHDLLKTQEQYDDWFNGEAKQKSIEFTKKYGLPVAIIKKDLEILEEIKNTYKVEHEGEHYWLINGKKLYMISKREFDKWSRWLDNE